MSTRATSISLEQKLTNAFAVALSLAPSPVSRATPKTGLEISGFFWVGDLGLVCSSFDFSVALTPCTGINGVFHSLANSWFVPLRHGESGVWASAGVQFL
jgi:hypothetical protein